MPERDKKAEKATSWRATSEKRRFSFLSRKRGKLLSKTFSSTHEASERCSGMVSRENGCQIKFYREVLTPDGGREWNIFLGT